MGERSHKMHEGSATRAPSLRLFYALWPDEQTRDQLAALQAGIHGRKVDIANLHLTLAFLGNQPRDSLTMLDAVMQSLSLTPFLLTLDGYGYFSKPQIVWAGPSSPPEALMSLQRSLWESLSDHGVALKPVAGFRPHVTLARDAERLDRAWESPVEWPVGTIALVESIAVPGGVRYRPLASRKI